MPVSGNLISVVAGRLERAGSVSEPDRVKRGLAGERMPLATGRRVERAEPECLCR